MIASLLILPSDLAGDALLAERDGEALRTRWGSSHELLTQARRPLALVLPGQFVRAFVTELPATIKSRDRVNIARFAHEDQLAVPPSDLHIVVGAGEQAATYAIDPEIMTQIIETADPHLIIADFDALADFETSADGGSMPGDLFLLDRIVRPGPVGLSLDPDWVDGTVLRPNDQALAEAMMSRIERRGALNLRSGQFRRRTKIEAGPWGRVAALFVICCGLGLGISLADARAKSMQADALADEARALYTELTGQTPPQPLSRLARSVSASEAGAQTFLDLSEHLFQALDNYPAIKVQRLSYDAQERALRLSLIYPNFEAATALEQAFSDRGTIFVTGGVREQNGDFIGDANLRLSSGAPS